MRQWCTQDCSAKSGAKKNGIARDSLYLAGVLAIRTSPLGRDSQYVRSQAAWFPMFSDERQLLDPLSQSLHHGGTIMKAPFQSHPTSADAADAAIYVQT